MENEWQRGRVQARALAGGWLRAGAGATTIDSSFAEHDTLFQQRALLSHVDAWQYDGINLTPRRRALFSHVVDIQGDTVSLTQITRHGHAYIRFLFPINLRFFVRFCVCEEAVAAPTVRIKILRCMHDVVTHATAASSAGGDDHPEPGAVQRQGYHRGEQRSERSERWGTQACHPG